MSQHHPPQHENPLDFTPESVPVTPNEAVEWWAQCFTQHEKRDQCSQQETHPAYVPNFPL